MPLIKLDCVAPLVTNPLVANSNSLQNPPICQATTSQPKYFETSHATLEFPHQNLHATKI